ETVDVHGRERKLHEHVGCIEKHAGGPEMSAQHNPHSALDNVGSRDRTCRMPTAAVMPSGTIAKQRPWPCSRSWCDHTTNPANLASVGGGGAMYAVTAGSENSVNSVETSEQRPREASSGRHAAVALARSIV